ncbi:MAG: hypothetical protein IKQ31_01705 [Clostridia bacterium]|nr:hypothetical protein [Clostridia bacterium]
MKKLLRYKQNLDFFLNLIDSRLNTHDYLGALDGARRALSNSKSRIDNDSLNLIIGQIYFEMGLHTLSCEHFFRAISIKETSASALLGISMNLIKLKKYPLALEYLESCSLTPSNVDFSQVIEHYINIISDNIYHHHSPTTVEIAKSLISKKFYSEAIDLITSSSKFDNETQLLLASAYIKANQTEAAREIIFRILHQNPSDISASLSLCDLCYSLHDYPNLVTILQKFDTIPLNFNQYVTISRYYFTLQNWNKAIHFLLAAHECNPYNATVLYYISLCYLNQNNKREAIYYLSQAKWIDIENPLLNAMLDAITQDLIIPPVEIQFSLPQNVSNQKIDYIESSLNSNFCKIYQTSLWLENDIDWYLSFHEKNSEKIVNCLSNCKQKKSVKHYKRLLLTARLHLKQKFILLKHAFLSHNISKISFTTNFRYKTVKNHLPKQLKTANQVLQNGFINALCYSIIFGLDFSKSKFNQISLSPQLDENICACLYFADSPHLDNICRFFKVEPSSVLSTWQQISKGENNENS